MLSMMNCWVEAGKGRGGGILGIYHNISCLSIYDCFIIKILQLAAQLISFILKQPVLVFAGIVFNQF